MACRNAPHACFVDAVEATKIQNAGRGKNLPRAAAANWPVQKVCRRSIHYYNNSSSKTILIGTSSVDTNKVSTVVTYVRLVWLTASLPVRWTVLLIQLACSPAVLLRRVVENPIFCWVCVPVRLFVHPSPVGQPKDEYLCVFLQ